MPRCGFYSGRLWYGVENPDPRRTAFTVKKVRCGMDVFGCEASAGAAARWEVDTLNTLDALEGRQAGHVHPLAVCFRRRCPGLRVWVWWCEPSDARIPQLNILGFRSAVLKTVSCCIM